MLNSLQNRVTASAGGRWAAMLIGTFVGALPGVLVGAIISNLGRISSLTGMVVISGAIGGYLWSRMPLRLPGFLYIAALSVAMILAGELAATYINGVYYLCKEYGIENFWMIATQAVPEIIRSEPEIKTDIMVNGGLSVLLALPVGFLVFLKARRVYRAVSGEANKNPFLSLRACCRDREGNPYLAVSRSFAVFMLFVLALCGALVAFLFYVQVTEGGDGAVLAIFGAVFVGFLALCVYRLNLRYTLTGQGLAVRRFFHTRLIHYEELRGPVGPGKMVLEGPQGRYLILPHGDGRIRINTFATHGSIEFIQELAERARLEPPWNLGILAHDVIE